MTKLSKSELNEFKALKACLDQTFCASLKLSFKDIVTPKYTKFLTILRTLL
jgi:hypothetical protein